MIKIRDGLIEHTKLEGIEKELFIEFLKLEELRHQEDIIAIRKTIDEIKSSKPSLNSRTIQSADECPYCHGKIELIPVCTKCHRSD